MSAAGHAAWEGSVAPGGVSKSRFGGRFVRPYATLQLGPLDCGPANILSLLRTYGRNVDRRRVRELCGTNDAGTSLYGLQIAAEALGLVAEIRPLDIHDLLRHSSEYLPAIVSLSGSTALNHYVTIYGFKKSRAIVMDPTVGLITMKIDELWIRMAREPIHLSNEMLAAEERSSANRQDLIIQLREAGIEDATIEAWLSSNSLFRLDDCLKYAIALCRLNGRRSFGPLCDVIRGLVEETTYALPSSVKSYSISEDGKPQLVSPLVIVVRRPNSRMRTQGGRRDGVSWDYRRRVLDIWRRHWKIWLPLIVFATCLLFLQLMSPLAMQLLVDGLDHKWPPAVVIIGAAAGAQFLAVLLASSQSIVSSRLEKRLSIAWSVAFLGKLQQTLDPSDRYRSSGELLSRAEECGTLAKTITTCGAVVWRAGLGLLATGLALFNASWMLLIIPLLGLMASVIMQELLVPHLARRMRRSVESSTRLNATLVEQLRGLEALKLLDADRASFVTYDEHQALASGAQIRVVHWQYLLSAVTGMLGGVTLLALALAAYSGMVKGALTPGQVVAVFALAGQFEGNVRALLQQRRALENQSILLERIEEFIHDTGRSAVSCAIDLTRSWHSVALRDCTFCREGGRPILDELSVDLYAGDTMCIVGGSGAGKTTLLDILAGIDGMQSGAVFIDSRMIPCDAVALIGAYKVEQEPVMLAGTLKENVLFGLPDPGDGEIGRACFVADIHDFVERHAGGMDHVIKDTCQVVSAGEASRICLARALLRRPKVLMLDESLSTVARDQRKIILERLRAYNPELVIVLVSHDSTDCELCDRTLKLEHGKLVEIARQDAVERCAQ